MVWKSIVMFYYSQKYFEQGFNLSHMTKVGAQTFARGEKPYIFLDFINRKYFTLILKMNLIETILVNCNGKFCDWHGHFQNSSPQASNFIKS